MEKISKQKKYLTNVYKKIMSNINKNDVKNFNAKKKGILLFIELDLLIFKFIFIYLRLSVELSTK